MNIKTFWLMLTAAITLAGNICRAGTIVKVDEPTARNLLHRGKARLATEDELTEAGMIDDAAGDEFEGGGAGEDEELTRDHLDDALAELPGGNTDPDYVVNAMREFYGELFTDEDEARVRETVKAPAPKPSDGLTPAQLQDALKAKNIQHPKKADREKLAALLDAAE